MCILKSTSYDNLSKSCPKGNQFTSITCFIGKEGNVIFMVIKGHVAYEGFQY